MATYNWKHQKLRFIPTVLSILLSENQPSLSEIHRENI